MLGFSTRTVDAVRCKGATMKQSRHSMRLLPQYTIQRVASIPFYKILAMRINKFPIGVVKGRMRVAMSTGQPGGLGATAGVLVSAKDTEAAKYWGCDLDVCVLLSRA